MKLLWIGKKEHSSKLGKFSPKSEMGIIKLDPSLLKCKNKISSNNELATNL